MSQTIELLPDYAVEDPVGAWHPNMGLTRLQCIDEGIPGNNADYVTGDAEAEILDVRFVDSPADVTSVIGVDVKIEAAKPGTGATSINAQLWIDGTFISVVNQPLSGIWQWTVFTINDPAWDGPWTKAQLDSVNTKVLFDPDLAGKTDNAMIDVAVLVVEYEVGRITRNTRQTMNVASGVGFMTQRVGKARPRR